MPHPPCRCRVVHIYNEPADYEHLAAAVCSLAALSNGPAS